MLQYTNIVVDRVASLPVVLVDNRLYNWDGLVAFLDFVNVHSTQHHLVFIIAVAVSQGGKENCH